MKEKVCLSEGKNIIIGQKLADLPSDLPSKIVSNIVLGPTKCLLKQLSISDLPDTATESTINWGGNSDERELEERDFMVCQSLL